MLAVRGTLPTHIASASAGFGVAHAVAKAIVRARARLVVAARPASPFVIASALPDDVVTAPMAVAVAVLAARQRHVGACRTDPSAVTRTLARGEAAITAAGTLDAATDCRTREVHGGGIQLWMTHPIDRPLRRGDVVMQRVQGRKKVHDGHRVAGQVGFTRGDFGEVKEVPSRFAVHPKDPVVGLPAATVEADDFSHFER